LAHQSLSDSRRWTTSSTNERLRLTAKTDQLQQEVALVREEIRIKDLRMATIPAARRPHYRPTERLAILELRAARGWSLEQTARIFHLTNATITSWCRRLDEDGPRRSCGLMCRSINSRISFATWSSVCKPFVPAWARSK